MNADFYIPTRLIFGEDALKRGRDFMLVGKHALIVTGKRSAIACGALGDVTAILDASGIGYTIFDKITENPPLLICYEGGRLAREVGADLVIGIGGGSPLDAAKAIAAFAANGELTPLDIYDAEKRKCPALPLFAIPTTAGTGSEANFYSVLTLPNGKKKKTFKSPDCWFTAAFVDPRYTATMPHETAISTALDAFAHVLESYLSPKATLFSEKAALFAGEKIYAVLKKQAPSLSDEDRRDLSLAATVAGAAISVTGTGFPHPLGYSITLFDGIPHGRACAVFEGDFISYNSRTPEGRERLQQFAAACGTTPDEMAALLPRLADVQLHLSDDEIKARVEYILDAGNYVNSPYVLSENEIYDIYKARFGGN